jgi:surface antigen
MIRRSSLFLLAGLTFGPLAAHAQINPFRSTSRSGMTAEDFRTVDRAARELAAQGRVPDGTSKEWSNDRTGANGTITVVGTFHEKGMLCRKVSYTAYTRGSQQPETIVVNWCKTSRGWKMV